jgi:hypothetical protein
MKIVATLFIMLASIALAPIIIIIGWVLVVLHVADGLLDGLAEDWESLK